MPYTKAYTNIYQGKGQAVDTDETDLLGQANTRWDGVHDLASLYDQVQDEYINADNQQSRQETGESDTFLLGQTTYPAGQMNEDFVVVDPSLPTQPDSQELDFDIRSTDEPDVTHEDFVVFPLEGSGVSPFLATTDEDFVVVQDTADVDDAEELPEVDLKDYVESWTLIVPKIAALISHELWPQLRSYLESLPQFGDTNLEQVVNAVAEDVGVSTASTDGVGEGTTEGFAFYASLFDEMAQESELAEAAQIG